MDRSFQCIDVIHPVHQDNFGFVDADVMQYILHPALICKLLEERSGFKKEKRDHVGIETETSFGALLIYPKHNWLSGFTNYAGYLIKKIIRDHDTAETITKYSWIDFLVGDTIVSMYNDSSFVGIRVTVIKSMKPERFPIFSFIKFSYLIFPKRAASAAGCIGKPGAGKKSFIAATMRNKAGINNRILL